MRKKLILAVLLAAALALPLAAGDSNAVLLTPDGTLYSIESLTPAAGQKIVSSRYLRLTAVHEGKTTTVAVPATLSGGSFTRPAIEYDAASRTVILVWQQSPSGPVADLAYCTYRDGQWTAAKLVDPTHAAARRNFRIALTTRTIIPAADGTELEFAETTVHVVWWETEGLTQRARYAMLTLEDGKVFSSQANDLADFASLAERSVPTPDHLSPAQHEILTQPLLAETAAFRAVVAVFGDPVSGTLRGVTLKPVSNGGHLRVPGGRGTRDLGIPKIDKVPTTNMSLLTGANNALLLYFPSGKHVEYVIHDGGWSVPRALPDSDTLSPDLAAHALGELIANW
jgi:hypothetical protein